MVIAAVIGAVGYVAFLLTEPDDTPPPTKHRTTSSRSTVVADADGILPQDRTAHFDPYTAPRHDAFNPRIVTHRAAALVVRPLSIHGNWVLTGISAIDGEPTALMENSTTGESVFLKPGDVWNGQRVANIGESAVTLVTPGTGLQSLITFPTPPDDSTKQNAPGAAAIAAPAADGAPTAPGSGPLPPAPVNLPAPPGFTATN
jgi:hypothetical protein